jgi:hypothetical protein
MKPINTFATLILLATLFTTTLAQTTTATLSGTVTDPQNAAVPGAKITVINTETGATRNVVSDDTGSYTVPLLPPGLYRVTVEREGFTVIEVNNVVLSATERVVLPVSLAIGKVGETVNVSADAGQLLLQAESGERNETVTGNELKEMPLNGRNIVDMFRFLPGFSPTNLGDQTSTQSNVFGSNNYSINGSRGNQFEINMDGNSVVRTGANNGTLVTANPDSIQEVKVLTSNWRAEYGRAGAAVIQTVTKSGTRQFHGGGRYFHRHDSLNSNTFFNNAQSGINPATTARPLYRYRYSGFDLGGPVTLPKKIFGPLGGFNEARQKMFFYFNSEFYAQLLPEGRRNLRVPTLAERNGDFSQSVDGNGARLFIRDPNIATNATTLCQATPATPVAGVNYQGACFRSNGVLNVIPQNRLSLPGRALINFMPLPNATSALNFNQTSQQSSEYPRRENILRVDYRFNERRTLAARWINNFDERRGNYGDNSTTIAYNFPFAPTIVARPGYSWNFTLTESFTPTLINELIVGFTRGNTDVYFRNNEADRTRNGLDSFPLLFPNANTGNLIPAFTFGNLGIANSAAAPSLTSNGVPFIQNILNLNISDNLTKVVQSHTFKFGVFWLRATNERNSFTPVQGAVNFAANTNNPINTGNAFANALLGSYETFTQADTLLNGKFRYNNLEWFAQDTWKMRRGFTLDYGVRFAWYQPAYDLNNQAVFFVPERFDPAKAQRYYQPICVGGNATAACGAANRRGIDPALLAAGTTPTTANTVAGALIGTIIPGVGDPLNGMVRARDGYFRAGFESPRVVYAPRIGFGWDIFGNGRTVLRGGFGANYDRVQFDFSANAINNAPNVSQPQFQFGLIENIASLRGQTGVAAGPRQNTIGFSSDGNIPVIYNYSLGVQRNLGWKTMLDIAYVGNVTRHLPATRNLNAVPLGAAFRRENQDRSQFALNTIPTVQANLPAAYTAANLSYTGSLALAAQYLRPYQGYGGISYRDFSGTSNYNALQVGVNRRYADRFSLRVSYTYSKALNTSSGDLDAVGTVNVKQYNYGLSNFDRTHILAVNYNYSVHRLSKYISDHAFVKGVLDGWQFTGITTAGTGNPFSLGVTVQGVATARRFTGSDDFAPRFLLTGNPQANTSGNVLIDPSVFKMPGVGTLGLGPIQYLRNPNYLNFDFSLFKNFALGKDTRRTLQVRAELFNALNHTQFISLNGTTNVVTAAGAGGEAIFADLPNTIITNNLRAQCTNRAGETDCKAQRPLGQFFGEPNSARFPRVIQLQARFTF